MERDLVHVFRARVEEIWQQMQKASYDEKEELRLRYREAYELYKRQKLIAMESERVARRWKELVALSEDLQSAPTQTITPVNAPRWWMRIFHPKAK